MSENLNNVLLHYFINFRSAIDVLTKVTSGTADDGDVDNVYHNLGNLFGGIESFYKSNPKHRQAGFDFCSKQIDRAKIQLNSSEYTNKALRLEYLETIEEGINRIFKTDSKLGAGKRQGSSQLSTKQIVLVLFYTGILEALSNIPSNSGKAELLSAILDINPQNIREALTYIQGKGSKSSSIKTRANLEAVRNLFEKLGLRQHAEKVLADLEKLRKNL